MKKMLIYLLVSVAIATALSMFTDIDIPKDVLNTLYTVAGVIFSVGMSITISSKTDGVTNVSMKKIIRNSYLKVRNSFLYYFGIDTALFILTSFTIGKIPASFFNVLCLIFLLISVAYYIYNFTRLQELGKDIEDQVQKERDND